MSDANDVELKKWTDLVREKLSANEFKSVPAEAGPEVQDSKADREASALSLGIYEDEEKARRKAETRTIVETNLDRRTNRRLRWKYARWVFCYLVSYSSIVGIFLICAGFKIFGFTLPDTVLEFLVGSTAVSAIGLVLAVTTGLFGKLK
ncbi:MAG: hypothetical protein ROO70_13295 [Labrenzia sp.]